MAYGDAKDPAFDAYLGDGVYAGHDGYHVGLSVGDSDTGFDTIYLEPEVMVALVKYAIRHRPEARKEIEDALRHDP